MATITVALGSSITFYNSGSLMGVQRTIVGLLLMIPFSIVGYASP
jgi:hypothetical protein